MEEIMPLLTKEQRTAINTAMPENAKYGEVFEKIAEAQRDADLLVYQKREEYHKDLLAQMIAHTRKDFALEEAEWLEKWWKVTPTGECSGTCKEMDAHIASLREKVGK
jgi:hypothetical protein